ncbi:hypothetical protein PENARI_c005G10475 [Penicillium arizonense]|uniref:Cyclase n=1 Tax=Penicillium arizonense TaxID=1835702 RepID=A0A1F5LNJ9_PENAI|nr:hypothetical protein PENARI_c005G10475 [Penicillium arizonense]OGE54792.1 hypothetical protein PENARI_c005G10475 [Penicillium arizonense]
MAGDIPSYKSLPIRSDAPTGSAWGVFDKDGVRDVYGTLNFITRKAVVAAREEIQTGESVVLNLPLDEPSDPCPGRRPMKHEVYSRVHGMVCSDDDLHLNTQSSSQWDGLLHYANQSLEKYYNGVDYVDAIESRTDQSLGIQALSERGGVAARGVLLDFVRYAGKHSIDYDVFSNFPISLDHIKEMITDQGLRICPGDILIIRTGLSKGIRESDPRVKGFWDRGTHIGVDPTPELIEWIWDQNLAAVASDAVAFECIPASDNSRMRLHEACLAGFGMPIGELFDLEALAALAEKNQRWSFFLTVCPLNVRGGVATIANTMAIF